MRKFLMLALAVGLTFELFSTAYSHAAPLVKAAPTPETFESNQAGTLGCDGAAQKALQQELNNYCASKVFVSENTKCNETKCTMSAPYNVYYCKDGQLLLQSYASFSFERRFVRLEGSNCNLYGPQGSDEKKYLSIKMDHWAQFPQPEFGMQASVACIVAMRAPVCSGQVNLGVELRSPNTFRQPSYSCPGCTPSPAPTQPPSYAVE